MSEETAEVVTEEVAEETTKTEESTGEKLFAGKYKTVEDMEAGYGELASKLGTQGKDLRDQHFEEFNSESRKSLPESADGYDFTPAEGVIPEGYDFKMDKTNPVFLKFRDKAHELGITTDGFNDLTNLYIENELSMLPDVTGEMTKLGENAQARINRVDMWATKYLSPEQAKAVTEVSNTAVFIEAMESMIDKAGDVSLEGGGENIDRPLSRDDLEQMMRDPRYRDPRSRSNDYVKKVEEGFAALK